MKLDPLARVIVNEARKRRLTYSQLSQITYHARRRLGLTAPHGPRHLPQILPGASL